MMVRSGGNLLFIPSHRIAVLFFFTLFITATQAQKSTGKPTRFDGMQIRSGHPRIWIDANKAVWLKEKCKGKSPDEVAKLAGPSVSGLALTYLITGDEKYGHSAVDLALNKPVDSARYNDLSGAEQYIKTRLQNRLVDQALCYDWCYSILSAEEKIKLRDHMIPQMRKRKDFKRNWRSFHNGMYNVAWPLTAGMLAIYGDDPYAKEVFDFLKPELEDAMKTFDNLFPDGEWCEGMDYNRHSTYPALHLFLALKSATGVDVIANSPHFKNTGKYILYSAKPNGLALPSDDNDWPFLGDWEHITLLMLNAEYRDEYNQYFINHCPVERFKLEPVQQYFNLLWYDSSIKEKPLKDLPLSRIFRGKGLVMARSNWNWDMPGKRASDTWLSFHCGDYLGDHVHYDINSFSIYHQGDQAIDAGRYDDDWDVSETPAEIIKSQFFNYYKRSIAHNTILVKDPNEKMNLNLVNDGGQVELLRINGVRNTPEDYEQGNFPSDTGTGTCDWVTNPGRWETGDITSYKSTNDFMYVRGDGTKAYAASKMNSFVRQLFYLQPDIVVVMDRVVSTNSAFKKTWLLHSVNEPVFNKNDKSFELLNEDGRLVCIPVLPHKIELSKVGGTGNEFLVDTTHYKCGLNSIISPSELHYGEIPGAWRVEVSPAAAATEDYFLNVLMVSHKNSKEIPVVKILSETAAEISISVSSKDGKSAVLKFAKGETPSAQIKIMKGNKVIADERMPDVVELEKGRE